MSLPWQPLKAGDTVRIIAPGSKMVTSWDDLHNCCEFLRAMDLNPVYSKRIFADPKVKPSGYYDFANTDESRYEDFVDAFQSDAHAIWCFRGGYGSDRVCHQLASNQFVPSTTPKLFIGFSDITNFHSYINSHWKWSTLHAPSIFQLGSNKIVKDDVEWIRNILFGAVEEIHLPLTAMNPLAASTGTLKGEIAGGNLTVLQSAINTDWQMTAENKIILFEDWAEAPYRVARMLRQFLSSKQLQGAHAIILGDFFPEKSGEDSGNTAMQAVLDEFAQHCSLPVFRYEGIGHGENNFPIPLGSAAKLRLGEMPELVAATGAAF